MRWKFVKNETYINSDPDDHWEKLVTEEDGITREKVIMEYGGCGTHMIEVHPEYRPMIETAPEMLAELENVLHHLETGIVIDCNRIKNIIKKANGEH